MLKNDDSANLFSVDYDKYFKDTKDQLTQENYIFPRNDDKDRSIQSNEVGSDNEYFVVLPSNIDVLREVRDEIGEINDSPAKESAHKFALEFQEVLINFSQKYNIPNKLPPLSIQKFEDESVLIEWAFNDFRIGFSFEKCIDNSSWYIVAKKELRMNNTYGPLFLTDVKPLIYKVLIFVLDAT